MGRGFTPARQSCHEGLCVGEVGREADDGLVLKEPFSFTKEVLAVFAGRRYLDFTFFLYVLEPASEMLVRCAREVRCKSSEFLEQRELRGELVVLRVESPSLMRDVGRECVVRVESPSLRAASLRAVGRECDVQVEGKAPAEDGDLLMAARDFLRDRLVLIFPGEVVVEVAGDRLAAARTFMTA